MYSDKRQLIASINIALLIIATIFTVYTFILPLYAAKECPLTDNGLIISLTEKQVFTITDPVTISTTSYSYHEIYHIDNLGKKVFYRACCSNEDETCKIEATLPPDTYFLNSYSHQPTEFYLTTSNKNSTIKINSTIASSIGWTLVFSIFTLAIWFIFVMIIHSIINQ